MKWPESTWIEGTPDDSCQSHYTPERWAQLMLQRKLHKLKCIFGHSTITLCGTGMYQCERCSTWWIVGGKMTPTESEWRQIGFHQ